ncbi:FAD-dependent oxidoreductase [Ureibacillus acetophenoni]|uniref:FAD dependent oxidoreductase n=1 Tax=Ureibacillus acetophenoni TaxID=614649 RepID=A0A285U320_9BACL|nr:FAD-dependent oxidoreductase [Ureibacillus acetophenoni]SOC34886.1 FAD dependent oxidoreductase [Ureibacillus acetophenoni]
MSKSKIFLIITAFVFVFAVGFVGFYVYKNLKDPVVTSEPIPYEKPDAVSEFNEEYDVIVIGGEPEGVAAAVSAARNGAKTLLIESRAELGGLFTYGMLNFLDIPQGEDGKSVSRGIYEEWHALVGGGNAFGIEQAKAAFKKLVDEEKNLTLSANTEVMEPIMEGNTVIGVKVKNEHGEFKISGKAFIDATQDAEFAAMSKVPYFVGGEDIGIKDKKMAVTLMIHLNDVNWDRVRETAKSEKFGPAEVTNSVAWGFSDLHYDYQPVEENTRLRGLNLVKIDNDYYINALQIFGINGLDSESKKEAIEKGKRETEHILAYLQKEFPGFEDAKIASFPTELYVRETRHIWAEYQLSMADVWTNRDHWDNIGYGAYPVDVQAQTPQDYGYVLSDPKQYAIPFRSLVPKEIEGLLVVGRSAGFSSLAAGSARVVPTGMVTGEAAGVAATIAIGHDISFRELSQDEGQIEYLRTLLTEQGAFVEHKESTYPYQGEWFDESVQTLINYGLVVGGYTNDLRVDEASTRHSFINMLKGAIERANPGIDDAFGTKLTGIHATEFAKENGPLMLEDVTAVLTELFIENAGTPSWQGLIDANIISADVASNISSDNHELTFKEMYAICAEVIEYVKQ